jgi:hypothetical protein
MTVENCEYCGRWLATIHEDGTFDLAPKASLTVRAKLEPGQMAAAGEPVPETAICFRWRCRLRRKTGAKL